MDDDDDTLLEELDTNLILKNLAIFDRKTAYEALPKGYTAATVYVDALPSSSLVWKEAIEQAEALINDGYKICFEIDLGLFGPNFKGIANQGQFQTLVLALDEFRGRLLARFEKHIEAVILYRSNATFTSIEERDIKMDYLDLLRQELPDDLVCLLLFNCEDMQDPYTFSRIFSPDRFCLFALALQSAPLLFSYCCWNKGTSMQGYIGRDSSFHKPQSCSKALMMPRFCNDAEQTKPLLEALIARNEHFKIISEDLLALEWEGLDILYMPKSGIALTSLRMADGFTAAGGTVVIELNTPES